MVIRDTRQTIVLRLESLNYSQSAEAERAQVPLHDAHRPLSHCVLRANPRDLLRTFTWLVMGFSNSMTKSCARVCVCVWDAF